MACTADELIPGLPEELARDCLLRVAYSGFPSAKSVCRLWRKEIESSDFHRLRKSTGVSRTLVAMVQAEHPAAAHSQDKSDPAKANSTSSHTSPFYRLVLLDPATGEWSTLASIPSLPQGLPLFCQVVAAAGPSLVVLGGWDPSTFAASDAVWVYDFLSGLWRQGSPMPGPRRSFFACASDDCGSHIYVAGGHDEEKNALRSALRYDVFADNWERVPDMTAERDECKGVFQYGKFQVLGGYSTDMQGQFTRSAESFDPETSAWEAVEEDALGASAGSCPRTCVTAGDRMYRCRAGKVEARGEVHGAEWAAVAEVPEDARVAPWVAAFGNGVMFIVGSKCHGGPHEGYVLQAASGKWRKVGIPEEYSGHVQSGCSIEI